LERISGLGCLVEERQNWHAGAELFDWLDGLS